MHPVVERCHSHPGPALPKLGRVAEVREPNVKKSRWSSDQLLQLTVSRMSPIIYRLKNIDRSENSNRASHWNRELELRTY